MKILQIQNEGLAADTYPIIHKYRHQKKNYRISPSYCGAEQKKICLRFPL